MKAWMSDKMKALLERGSIVIRGNVVLFKEKSSQETEVVGEVVPVAQIRKDI